jgi:hypothetical protein
MLVVAACGRAGVYMSGLAADLECGLCTQDDRLQARAVVPLLATLQRRLQRRARLQQQSMVPVGLRLLERRADGLRQDHLTPEGERADSTRHKCLMNMVEQAVSDV